MAVSVDVPSGSLEEYKKWILQGRCKDGPSSGLLLRCESMEIRGLGCKT